MTRSVTGGSQVRLGPRRTTTLTLTGDGRPAARPRRTREHTPPRGRVATRLLAVSVSNLREAAGHPARGHARPRARRRLAPGSPTGAARRAVDGVDGPYPDRGSAATCVGTLPAVPPRSAAPAGCRHEFRELRRARRAVARRRPGEPSARRRHRRTDQAPTAHHGRARRRRRPRAARRSVAARRTLRTSPVSVSNGVMPSVAAHREHDPDGALAAADVEGEVLHPDALAERDLDLVVRARRAAATAGPRVEVGRHAPHRRRRRRPAHRSAGPCSRPGSARPSGRRAAHAGHTRPRS